MVKKKKKAKKKKTTKKPKKKKGKKKLTKADVRRSEQVYGKAKDEYHRAGERVKKIHQAPMGSTDHWS
jgi:hypothetical protein